MKTTVKRTKVRRLVYDFKRADFDGLKEAISHTPLDVTFDCNDIDQCWECWRDLFLTTVDTFVPKLKIRDSKSPKWIDGEIIKLSKHKDKLWKLAKNSNLPSDWDKYRDIRKQVKTATKRKYRTFLKNLQDNLKDDPKQFWSFYRAKTKAARIPKVVNLGREKASTSPAKAAIFNKYFASVFQKSDYHKPTTTPSSSPSDNELHLIQVSMEEVLKALEAIDTSKACGPDQIPGRLLKECANEIAPSLTHLINLSLRLGHVPREWKCANVVPVFKKGNKEDVTNYRPISLLSLVDKIVERCVFDKFFPFLADRIYHLQHGFMKGRSTVTQLLEIVHILTQAIDQGNQTDIAFLDFSKAFDSVSHSLLVHKLHHAGIKGPLLQWFASYLHDRKQRVVIDGKSSEWLSVSSGVPQGSILGPALFVLFINDMPNVISNSSTLALFADDAKCLRIIKSVSDCVELQADIDNLTMWSVIWKLAFNIQKCAISTMSRKRSPIKYDYNIGDCSLKRVEEQRDLGVIMTSNAKFHEHIHAVVSKANKMLGLIRRTLTRDERLLPTLKTLYVALVRSHLEYASEVWSPTSVTLIKLIEGVQRRATRLLLPDLSYCERLQRLDLLPLVYRREIKDLTTFHKMIIGQYDCNFQSYIEFCSDKRLRSFAQGKLKTARCKSELFKGSFFNRIVYLWNNLPENLRTTSHSPSSFKLLCENHYKLLNFNPERLNVSWK